jgi:3-hydroxyisobutyrate dehydrogenase
MEGLDAASPLGFAGLGLMGQPMALNLARAGTPLVVWNRTAARSEPLREAGATVAEHVDDLFARARVVILMLADDAAIDAVLDRGGPRFRSRVRGHTVVHMGTSSLDFSRALDADIRAAGGRYVEAPVSGSRVPAQRGELVGLVAGEPDAVAGVRPLLAPMCRVTVDCGAVPGGLVMKLTVNVFLIAQVTGLAEAVHFGLRHGLQIGAVADALDAGQMASDISRVKLGKLRAGDLTAQASLADVLKNSRLVVEEARAVGAASPLLDVCTALYGEAVAAGLGGIDMIGVLRAIKARDGTPAE